MSLPEISHRCTSCGASFRGHAVFCPQCGHPLAKKNKADNEITEEPATPEPDNGASPNATEVVAAESTAVDGPPPTEGEQNAKPATNPAANSAARPGSEPERKPGRARTGRERAGASTALAANKARQTIQKATTAARDKLEDNVRPRVDKIRQASSVVLEEANYDPSVRFILVAGALFVLFLILLILSKVI